MFFVVISVWNNLFQPVLSESGFELVKIKDQNYFYYSRDDSLILSSVSGLLMKEFGPCYLFQVYSIYNGMIDLYEYRSQQEKDSFDYYTNKTKDLSFEEMNVFLLKKNNSVI